MIRHALISMSLVGVLASSAFAQLANQTALVGTVTDSSGSVIPGATVVAVNTGTKDTYETTTNEQGYYNIQFIRIGQYEITVTLSGFQTFKATGIEVATNQVVRRDASLQVGVMSETITVAAGAAMLSTENATLVETINERAVEELPLSGRNVWSLAGTTPGVLGGTSSFTGAGQRNIQNSLSMDGINTAANLLTATSMRPDLRRGDRGAGADRQHLRRVRLLPRRARQRRDQERDQRGARQRVRVPAARLARLRAASSRTGARRRIRGGAISSGSRWTVPCGCPSSMTGATGRSS